MEACWPLDILLLGTDTCATDKKVTVDFNKVTSKAVIYCSHAWVIFVRLVDSPFTCDNIF